ncbi:MAG: hypothetical protein ABFQ53_03545 [Patescibacteria group bacterium]
MDFEKPYTPEKRKGREYLVSLEKEGRFMFHGSPKKMDIITPQQAYGDDKKTNQRENDGAPGVFGTQVADIGIFHALMKQSQEGCEGSFGEGGDSEKGTYHMHASAALIERVKKDGLEAYVHILDKKDFSDFRAVDARSNNAVNVIDVVRVGFEDLPENIEIID